MSKLHIVATQVDSARRLRLGYGLNAAASLLLLGTIAAQYLPLGLTNWRPTLYAYVLWAIALCASQVIVRGEQGKRVLFVLPAALFVASLALFPLVFGLTIAFSDWNLANPDGRQFNGLANIKQMFGDTYFWRSMGNMGWYVLAILAEYIVAFGLALMLNAEIRGRKFFRVAFLLPLMLSPVAVSWMIGKSMLENRFGPVARLLRSLGVDNPTFFGDPAIAKLTIMLMDAWTYIPFMMIMLLAGLQAIPKDLNEAADVDGARGVRRFFEITFPIMARVSITAILIRVIFKLKLADIIITVTGGGPGGATDSVTSFIYREYRDRSNVGYGTMLAMFYLVVIVIGMTGLIKFTNRWKGADA
ncbi:carbohydrate ABC transporter permease [Pseudoprimorskyibacter insulae]|uniref:Trehalose transport system permease protein SugA n=1 Tax=Pseudoprimorskyibacter insulae TaxID=1695997 RepID=A0A2R8AZQ6_9RHOB|nr:sugar ABC transporter permease [Pseudoprimorskyibacter insulae]SPF81506.1 Trehalose transport system permease protein SugA [Pseudoprimorskyibacter insulae]